MKKVTIVGAGIAGLTTAIALKQRGFEVELYENSPAFNKAGSGINLAINAMQVLKKIGVYETVLKGANYSNSMVVRNKQFKILTKTFFLDFEKKIGVKTVAIHRAKLHQILIDHLGESKIHLDKKLKNLVQKNGKVLLNFEDGTKVESDIVIGADGIHSAVRKSIFDNTEIRDAKQVCWRGISNAKIDKVHSDELNEIWGKGNRFGFVHIAPQKIYWFALINKEKFIKKDMDLMAEFSDFHKTVNEILSKTPKEDILCNEIWDLKPIKKWYKGNVCLVGDSAHATTPNLGQGACQAIESAFAVSICLEKEQNISTAFQKYQKMRKSKATDIVKTSWFLGKIAQSNNAIICGLRNFIVPLIPSSVSKKESEKIFNIEYLLK